MKQAKSLADIGKIAGVSTATVSRALRDSPEIGEKMKEKIRELADEHNYTLNTSARNLRLKKTNTVAVILNAYDQLSGELSSQPYLLNVVAGLRDMMLSSERSASRCWNEYFVRSGRADGVVVLGQGDDVSTLKELAKSGSPFVVYGAFRDQEPYCVVGCDNRKGGLMATNHLIKDAQRRSLLYLGPTKNFDGMQRIEGFRQAVLDDGLNSVETKIIDCALSSEIAETVLAKELAGGLSFDGVFACSDEIAIGAIRCLQKHGFDVPKDVSVVGFDDVQSANYFSPALTTIRPHQGQLAEILVDSLKKMIAGKQVDSTEIPAQLVIRDSSVPDVT